MSGMFNTIVAALAEPVSPVLIHSLWQGLVIAVLLKVALTFISHRRAQARYAIATAALAATVIVCLITGFSTSYDPPAVTTAPGPADDLATVLASGSATHSVTQPVMSADNPGDFLTRERIDRWLIPIWIGGILLLTLRHAIGYRRARRLARVGTTIVPDIWSQRFTRICRQLRVSCPVRFLGSAIVKVPCVVGWFKPVVLFPVSSLANLSVGDVEMILAHELAHIRRNDVLVNIVQIMIETLLFFNPAVWWISRQIRIEREHCCDDMAIALTGDRLDYARALVNLEETRQAPGFAAAATATGIVARVRRIILHQSPRAQSAHMGVIAMLLLAAILIVGVTTLTGPAATDVSAATTFESTSAFEPGSDDLKGKWEIETNGKWSQVSISFKRNWQSGFSVMTRELLRDVDENTTDFQMVRDAGTFHFTGRFEREGDELWGKGLCYFRPNPDYMAKLASLGYELTDNEDAYEMAVHDITLGYVQGMHDAGYDLSKKKLVEAHIHDVTPEYIAALGEHGYTGLKIDKLIEMQIHDVDAEYISDLEASGYAGITPEKLVEMSIHDVDGDYVKGLAKEGYTDLEPSELVTMSIHDVTPEYITDIKELGYTDLTTEQIVAWQIHDIDADYIRGLRDLGYTDLDPSDLVAMHIHDVDPEYIAGLKKLGYTDLSPKQLEEFRIHDIDADYIRGLQDLGYTDLDPSDLVAMHIHDVDPDYVADLKKLGYSDLSPKRLSEFQIHDISIDYIRDLQKLGYTDVAPSDLVSMHIHDVDAGYIEALQKLGYTNLSTERLVEFRIHDVEPSYIEAMNALGLKEINPADLVSMMIHDVTPRFLKDMIELGYDDLTPEELVDMQIHDVTPAFVERMQKREGADLTPRDLIEFKIHGRR